MILSMNGQVSYSSATWSRQSTVISANGYFRRRYGSMEAASTLSPMASIRIQRIRCGSSGGLLISSLTKWCSSGTSRRRELRDTETEFLAGNRQDFKSIVGLHLHIALVVFDVKQIVEGQVTGAL